MRRELLDIFRRTQPGALDLNNMNNLDALAAAFNCRRCGSIATARIPAGGRQLCRQALRSRSHHNSRCWHKVCQRGIRHVASEEDANNASGGRPRTGRPCPKCELCLELCHAFVPFCANGVPQRWLQCSRRGRWTLSAPSGHPFTDQISDLVSLGEVAFALASSSLCVSGVHAAERPLVEVFLPLLVVHA